MAAVATPSIAEQAASWVRRARAGDQIAQAALMGVAKGAKAEAAKNVPAGRRKYQQYYDAAMAAVKAKPARKWWSIFGIDFGGDDVPAAAAVVTDQDRVRQAARDQTISLTPVEQNKASSVQRDGSITHVDMENNKPELPPGALDGLLDPDRLMGTVLNACRYKHGLNAAAIVLSNGPMLNVEQVRLIGMSDFGSEEASGIFFQGVRFCGDDDYRTIAGDLDPSLRRCLVVGQCVGRARKIQSLRNPNTVVGGVFGWELGE